VGRLGVSARHTGLVTELSEEEVCERLREVALGWVTTMGLRTGGLERDGVPEDVSMAYKTGIPLAARVSHIAAFAIRYGYITDDPVVAAAAGADYGVGAREMLDRIEAAQLIYKHGP